jgi:SAM-dependent methyltransferase
LIRQNYSAGEMITFSGALQPVEWYRSQPAAFKRQHQLVHGHVHYGIHEGLTEYLYFTFFRDPVARHFSDYDFLRRYTDHPMHAAIASGEIAPLDWASIWQREAMFRNIATQYVSGEQIGAGVDRLSLEKAKLHIRREFAFVGLSERFDESVLILAKRLRWRSVFYLTKNTTAERTLPSAEMARIASEGLDRDIELYEFAKSVFDEAPELRDPAFSAALQEFKATRAWLEAHVANNKGELYQVDFDLPPLDDIVRKHRQTPALDQFLKVPAVVPAPARLRQESPRPDTRRNAEQIEAAANRVRHSLLSDPPQVLPTLPMMITIGSRTKEHYLTNMREYTTDIIARTKLLPGGHVLDLGCGCGRVATGLARYLNEDGAYLGLDVWQEGIDWCNEHLTKFPATFTFETVQAANNYYYAPDSGASNLFDVSRVPSNDFHCIFAISLFTHLKLSDARQYLELVARALTTDGFAYLTFFVVDEDAKRYVAETGNHRSLQPAGDGMWYAYSGQDFFSGYDRSLLLAQFEECGLEIVSQNTGHWAKKPGARLYQDWFLLKRRGE